MRHRENQNRHSTSNHDNPQHHSIRESQRPDYLKHEYGITKRSQYTMKHGQVTPKYPTGPVPQQRKGGIFRKISERFKEKPATKEEINQLRLNTVREELKTRKQIAKTRRPSRFGGGGFSSGGSRSSGGRSGSRLSPDMGGSWLLDSGSSKGGFWDSGSSPSLDFITGANQKPKKGRNDGGLGSGLMDMFT